MGLDAADARVHKVAHNADTVMLMHGGLQTDEKEAERGFSNSQTVAMRVLPVLVLALLLGAYHVDSVYCIVQCLN